MLSETDFIDALRESPDDANLRLIYADWLDDAGNSRGELVRLQCELDRTPLGEPRRQVLHEALRELYSHYQADWLAPLQRRFLSWEKARLRFGLIENLPMSAPSFLRHAKAGLFEEMPHLVGVFLSGTIKPMRRALNSPYINRLKALKLRVNPPWKNESIIGQLASLDTVRNLTSLDLAGCQIGNARVAELLSSPNFPKLRRLNLRANRLDHLIARHLIHSSLLPELEMLALQWNSLGDWGVRSLMKDAPDLNLRSLDLSRCFLGDSSAWDLVNSDCLKSIQCLSVSENHFGRAAQSALESKFPNRVFFAQCEPGYACYSPGNS